MTSWWRHHTGHDSLIFGENGQFSIWKPDNLIVSHPIVIKLNMNDDMGLVTNSIWWCHDDVITRVTAHWFPSKTAHFWSECVITWLFLIRSSPNLIWMMTWDQLQTPFDDIMMTSSHGSLIFGKNGPFSIWNPDNLIVSHPIVNKLKMNDDMGSVTNPISWRHHKGHSSLIYGKNGPFLVWKRDNLIVSHPNVTKLNLNDKMGSVTNSIWWRH